jgi:hypothetical protein
MAAGIVVALLGLVQIVLSAIPSTDQSVLVTLRRLLRLFTLATAAGCLVVYLGYRHEEDILNGNSGNTGITAPTSTSGNSGNTAQTSTTAQMTGGGCTLSLSGHDVLVMFSGSEAYKYCSTTFPAEYTPTGLSWQSVTPNGITLLVVCGLINGTNEVVVYDDGGQYYGSQACQSLEANAWSQGP